MIRMFLAAAMTAACVMGCASIAAAQAGYPERPLQLIVPFPPGGAGDVVGPQPPVEWQADRVGEQGVGWSGGESSVPER